MAWLVGYYRTDLSGVGREDQRTVTVGMCNHWLLWLHVACSTTLMIFPRVEQPSTT